MNISDLYILHRQRKLDQMRFQRRSRIRTILQAEMAECGLACLAMISDHFGQGQSLAVLRRRFLISSKGMSLGSIANIAGRMGLEPRAVKYDIDELNTLNLPAIIHWENKHFVVLERVGKARCIVHDPAIGRLHLTRRVFEEKHSGIALELRCANPSLRGVEGRWGKAGRSHSPGLSMHAAKLIIIALMCQAVALIPPILTQRVVDGAIAKDQLNSLDALCLSFLLFSFIASIAQAAQGAFGVIAGNALAMKGQASLMDHLVRLPITWFEKRHTGDIVSRFGSVTQIQSILASSYPSLAMSTCSVIFCIVMMRSYAPFLALYALVALAAFFLFRLLVAPVVQMKTREGLQISSQAQSVFLETIRTISTIKMLGREQERNDMWLERQREAINKSQYVSMLTIVINGLAKIIIGLVQASIWWAGGKMVIDHTMSMGSLIAFNAYSLQLSGAATNLATQLMQSKTMALHRERLADILENDPESIIESKAGVERQVSLPPSVDVYGLSFRYGEYEPWILRDISISIQPGDIVAIVGPSGGGKTTLLKILLGLYAPQAGDVCIDGKPISEYGIHQWRSKIGAVMQDDRLLSGSIFDNISFFDPSAKEVDVIAAATRANINEDIQRFPMRYNSLVGDVGMNLSSGQKQRILLARALYRRPQVLVLDEGTANLDSRSESAIMDVVRSLAMTRIIVGHRAESLRGAHHIFSLYDGKIELAEASLGGLARGA